MINYSLFQAEFVFEEWDNFEPEHEIIELESGKKVIVEKNKEQFTIERIISSDPVDYLNSDIYPGLKIKDKNQLQLNK